MRRRTASGARSALALGLLVLGVACGPTHQIIFRMESERPGSYVSRQVHHVGLVGGGGFYLLVSQIVPRLIPLSGPIDLGEACRGGVAEVRQYHSAESNVTSALVSWLIVLDPYHATDVEIRCARS